MRSFPYGIIGMNEDDREEAVNHCLFFGISAGFLRLQNPIDRWKPGSILL